MLKVLIIDSDDRTRKEIVLSMDWAALDCIVIGEAADGQTGMELVEKYNPSLIITCIQMPKMDGLEFLRQLRSRENHTPVIILTEDDHFEYVRSALRLHASDYLLKPFRCEELEESIRNLNQALDGYEVSVPLSDLKRGEQSRYVQEAMNYIGVHYNVPDITVRTIADSLGISEGYLSHVFKKETNYTLLNYLTRYRIQKAMELLLDYKIKVYEVAGLVGYRDTTYFSTTFKKFIGVSPSEYQASKR